MATDLMQVIEATQLRDDVPEFSPGDTVSVHVRVIEGQKERIQKFEGVVIKSHGGADAKGVAAAIDIAYDMAHYDLMRTIRDMLDETPAVPSA